MSHASSGRSTSTGKGRDPAPRIVLAAPERPVSEAQALFGHCRIAWSKDDRQTTSVVERHGDLPCADRAA